MSPTTTINRLSRFTNSNLPKFQQNQPTKTNKKPNKPKKKKTENPKHPQKYPPKPVLEYVTIINIFLWKLSHALSS